MLPCFRRRLSPFRSAVPLSFVSHRMQCVLKEVKTPPETVKLAKVMALLGACSRREAEKLIRNGKVMVENRVIKNVATRIFPYGVKVKIDGREVSARVLA